MKKFKANRSPEGTRLECPCGWSRFVEADKDPEPVARYHAIQVHNDQEAVKASRVF